MSTSHRQHLVGQELVIQVYQKNNANLWPSKAKQKQKISQTVCLCNLGKLGFRKSFTLPIGDKEIESRDWKTDDKIIFPAVILVTRAFQNKYEHIHTTIPKTDN